MLDNGNYVVVETLARGGMGAIYLAKNQRAFQRIVVIKAMLGYFNQHNPQEVQEAHQRFEQEGKILANLNHSAIPHIIAYFRDGKDNYIVMEHITGRDLEKGLTSYDDARKPIQHGQPYDDKDVISWGIALCNVLEYLSSQQPHPIVHHDIKPANLILDTNKAIHLVDFGAAQVHSSATAGSVSSQQAAFGTLGYAPPEQHQHKSEPRSDVYALAATLYHLATDDDPRFLPCNFPELKRLGKFGEALSMGLKEDLTNRPHAKEFKKYLEKLVAPAPKSRAQPTQAPVHAQPIQTPDGAVITNEHELALWTEQHWADAAAWLYQRETLAEQIAKFWAKNKLAGDIRSIVKQHPSDMDAGLDALLALLDPQGFGAATSQLQANPSKIDFGSIPVRTPIAQHVAIRNIGRRFVRATIVLPIWVKANTTTIQLQPGADLTLILTPDLRQAPTAHQVANSLQVVQNGKSLLHIPVRGALLAPDYQTVVRTKQELADWCEGHWPAARQWLYDGLPEQIACLWEDAALAAKLRLITQQHKGQQSLGLDAALALLDPQGYGMAPSQLASDVADIALGGTSDRSDLDKAVTLTNHGRRVLALQVIANGWITVMPQQVMLNSGTSTACNVRLDVAHTGDERVPNTVQLFAGSQQLLQIVVYTPLRAPDGITLLATEALLADWCVQHWAEAVAWLYSDLPDQIEFKRGVPAWAHLLRAVVAQHARNRDKGMNAALDILEPAATAAQIQVDQSMLHFGTLLPRGVYQRELRLSNPGRRSLEAQLQLPPWISATTTALHLLPGMEAVISLIAHPPDSALRKNLRDTVKIRTKAGRLVSLPVQAHIPRSSTLVNAKRRHPIVVTLISLLLVFIIARAAVWGYWHGLAAWHYRQGSTALEHHDWPRALQEFELVLSAQPDNQEAPTQINETHYHAAQEALSQKDWPRARLELTNIPGYRDTADLVKQSYYLPAVAAIQQQQWDDAAETIVSLEQFDEHYRDIPDFIAENPFLFRACSRLRAGVWLRETAQAQVFGGIHKKRVIGVAFSSDGQVLASASTDMTIQLRRVTDKLLLQTLYRSTPVQSIAFSADTPILAAGYLNGDVVLWNTTSGKSDQAYNIGVPIQSIASGPGRGLIAAGDTSGTITLLFQDERGVYRKTAKKAHRNAISILTFSPDGRFLVSSSGDNTFKVWAVDTTVPNTVKLSPLFTQVNTDGNIQSMAFDPDGKFLAVGDSQGSIRLWRIDTDRLILVPGAKNGFHTRGVTSLAFSSDSSVLASASNDRSLKLWRTSDRSLLQTLQTSEEWQKQVIQTVAFSPDGRTLAVGDWGSAVRFWKAQP